MHSVGWSGTLLSFITFFSLNVSIIVPPIFPYSSFLFLLFIPHFSPVPPFLFHRILSLYLFVFPFLLSSFHFTFLPSLIPLPCPIVTRQYHQVSSISILFPFSHYPFLSFTHLPAHPHTHRVTNSSKTKHHDSSPDDPTQKSSPSPLMSLAPIKNTPVILFSTPVQAPW